MIQREPIGIYSYSALSGSIVPKKTLSESLNGGRARHSVSSELGDIPVMALQDEQEAVLLELRHNNRILREVDRTALLAVEVGKSLQGRLTPFSKGSIGLAVGSSRGPTASLEEALSRFYSNEKLKITTSPVTTFGNLTTSVAQALEIFGPLSAHSATCTGGLLSLIHGWSQLQSGLCDGFLAIGAEAPLTPFTAHQMELLSVLASSSTLQYPCQPMALAPESGSGMLLGEGAAALYIEKVAPSSPPPSALISGFGMSSERLHSLTGVSEQGEVFYHSMKKALKMAHLTEVDLIITHAPGTRKGDDAERKAISHCFGNPPPLYSPKWLLGHTFGAAGTLSAVLATELLEGNVLHSPPYAAFCGEKLPLPHQPEHILINSAGFGGIAVSVILSSS